MDHQKNPLVLKELQIIPGIGKSIAEDLYALNIRSVSDLKGKNPQVLYERACQIAGAKIDPCLLYTFRCAIYFASTSQTDPELLKWWHWKDKVL